MNVREKVLDLLFPPKCPFCRKILDDPRAPVCPDCRPRLPWLEGKAGERSIDFTDGCFSPLAYRDAVAGDRKLVMDLQGRPTARFMFFNGLSYGRKNGEITYLENPYIQENLAFSFQVQVAANEYYPGIARKIYLKAYRYNMHFKPKTLLIEAGAQTNTVDEMRNAVTYLADVLDTVLTK